MEIAPSARRHEISDDDIRHAARNAIATLSVADQPDFTMLIGPDTAGRLVEVGVLSDEDDDYIIHAMLARPRYVRLVAERRPGES